MLTVAQLSEVIGVGAKATNAAYAAAVAGRAGGRPGIQGVARVVSGKDALIVAAAFVLRRDFGCSITRAVSLATRLVESGGTSRISAVVTASLDLSQLREVVRQAAADVVAASPPPKRGRPPRKRNRGAP